MQYTHPDGRIAQVACVWNADPDMGQPTAGYLVLEYADAATWRTSGWSQRYEFDGSPDDAAILARLGSGWVKEA